MNSQIQYTTPEIPLLLITISFLYFNNLAEAAFAAIINAGLIGPLAVGIIYGSEAANLLPLWIEESFNVLGYIGLLLLVFEAGLQTNVKLLFKNIYLSTIVAFTGIGLPIAFSLFLLDLGYGYRTIQSFGAGAALCSTSLGTTLSLLRPEFKNTRTGTVLLSAALIDDIVGLVLAAIIPNLLPGGSSPDSSVNWPTIVRPIGVSLAFGFGTPIFAYVLRYINLKIPQKNCRLLYTSPVQVFLIVSAISGFVAGAKYTGTSELFGAYLAGALLAYAFPSHLEAEVSSEDLFTPERAFELHFQPVLRAVLSPIFFASIGFSLPIRSLFLVDGSRRVIWRGIIYSLLMILAKALTGAWLLVWPDDQQLRGWFGRSKGGKREDGDNAKGSRQDEDGVDMEEGPAQDKSVTTIDASPKKGAIFMGLAMVPRGEIALIVAQLARPLLEDGTQSEPFAVVIWAILVTTIGGAVGVGLVLRAWDKSS